MLLPHFNPRAISQGDRGSHSLFEAVNPDICLGPINVKNYISFIITDIVGLLKVLEEGCVLVSLGLALPVLVLKITSFFFTPASLFFIILGIE